MTETFINHCAKMYQALHERAVDKELSSGQTARVFTGSYTDAWKSTGISQTYYSPIRKWLEKNKAILVLQTGGRSVDTVIVLQGLPDTPEADGWLGNKGLTESTNYARLAESVAEIKKSLGGLNIVEILAEFETRVKSLEEQIQMFSPRNTNKPKEKK
jgi:hypothetical protein